MKKQIVLAISATTLTFFSATVWADDLNNANTNYPNATYARDRDDAQSFRTRHMGDLRKADHLIGLAVKNDAGETIGKVKDLAIDLQNARIVSVIVATGGFAGVDRKLVAVPPSLFSYDEPNKSLRTSIDKNQFQNAPEFKFSDWKSATEDGRVRESYQYFSVPTYYGAQPQADLRNGNDNDANVNSANNSPTLGNGKPRDITGLNDAARTIGDNGNTSTVANNTDPSANNANNNSPTAGNGKNREASGQANSSNNGSVDNNGNAVAVLPAHSETYPNSEDRNHGYTNADGTVTWNNASRSERNLVSTYYPVPRHSSSGTNDYDYYRTASYYDRQHPQTLGTVERASKVIGSTAYNNENEKIGKVETLVMDLHSGRIIEVVLATGGFLGMDAEYSAVPPQSFQYDIDKSRLTLEVTKNSLQSSPHFRKNEWETATQPENINEVYHVYHAEPYFAPANSDVDNTARNVRDRSGEMLTPADQGNNKPDIQTTAQIRKAVLAIDQLSTSARNVKIITVNGHVTLRGVVKTDEEKREVADAASRIAGDNQVDNQLEVKGATPISTDSAK